MLENKTVRNLIKEAINFYDKGEWDVALLKLQDASADKNISTEIKQEIKMHKGWNLWKKGQKDAAAFEWEFSIGEGASLVTQASAHAGLEIYYAEKDDKEKTRYHGDLALKLLPDKTTINHAVNLNAHGISLAKMGELDRAEQTLKKAAKINEQFEASGDSELSEKGKHQRAKNGYNLAALVYMDKTRKEFNEAIEELQKNVIPRYVSVGAESDLAAAYHRVSESYENLAGNGNILAGKKMLDTAIEYETLSWDLWLTKNVTDRAETAEKNVKHLKEKILKIGKPSLKSHQPGFK